MSVRRQPCAFPGCGKPKHRSPSGMACGSWCREHLTVYSQRRNALEKEEGTCIHYTNAQFIAEIQALGQGKMETDEVAMEGISMDINARGMEVHIRIKPGDLHHWHSDDIRNYFKMLAEQIILLSKRQEAKS